MSCLFLFQQNFTGSLSLSPTRKHLVLLVFVSIFVASSHPPREVARKRRPKAHELSVWRFCRDTFEHFCRNFPRQHQLLSLRVAINFLSVEFLRISLPSQQPFERSVLKIFLDSNDCQIRVGLPKNQELKWAGCFGKILAPTSFALVCQLATLRRILLWFETRFLGTALFPFFITTAFQLKQGTGTGLKFFFHF